MRGKRDPQITMLAFIDLEERVPLGHPLRTIKRLADEAAFADLLRSAGLRDVGVRAVRMMHPAASPREVWDGLLGGTVRNAAFIRAQAAAVQERIRDEFERRLGATMVHGELELSVEIKIARGTNAAG